ncbi:MAG: hypothetical protein PHO48_04635 [Candidatus Gracilibacteria bacterium]|nr:hypothetical protein [Candidatus Gracilibacteria bacterium]
MQESLQAGSGYPVEEILQRLRTKGETSQGDLDTLENYLQASSGEVDVDEYGRSLILEAYIAIAELLNWDESRLNTLKVAYKSKVESAITIRLKEARQFAEAGKRQEMDERISRSEIILGSAKKYNVDVSADSLRAETTAILKIGYTKSIQLRLLQIQQFSETGDMEAAQKLMGGNEAIFDTAREMGIEINLGSPAPEAQAGR